MAHQRVFAVALIKQRFFFQYNFFKLFMKKRVIFNFLKLLSCRKKMQKNLGNFFSFHVLILSGDVEIFKHVSKKFEGRPFQRIAVPTLEHYLKRIERFERTFQFFE